MAATIARLVTNSSAYAHNVDIACVLKVRTVFYDTAVKKLAMSPKYFCFLTDSVSHLQKSINTFELVYAPSSWTSGVMWAICLFSTDLSFCFWLTVSSFKGRSLYSEISWFQLTVLSPNFIRHTLSDIFVGPRPSMFPVWRITVFLRLLLETLGVLYVMSGICLKVESRRETWGCIHASRCLALYS